MKNLQPNEIAEEAQLLIEKKTYSEERALYALNDAIVSECRFEGEEDGESPLKEAQDVTVEKCFFDLRYALWHNNDTRVVNSTFSNKCRAPFWYGDDIEFLDCTSESVKIFRECRDLIVQNSKIISEEPFWKCNDVNVVDSEVSGFYAFFGSRNVNLNHVKFTGKYSFQYINNLTIKDSELDTKDAFWHCNHVKVINSTIKGEYIGWYSKNITFINCVIESHQPFCYCNNIKFINCKMPNSDLAFENSFVHGNILGKVDSIKNFRKGRLVVDEVGEILIEKPLSKCKGKIDIVKK